MSEVNTPSKHSSHAATPLPSNSAPALPPPQTFDVLPPLHSLLMRLVPQLISHPDQQPLEPQHLATESSVIKIRLQKARTAVEAMPDVERNVAEQEEEIKGLEERIAKQREVLRSLSEAGMDQDGDVVMKQEQPKFMAQSANGWKVDEEEVLCCVRIFTNDTEEQIAPSLSIMFGRHVSEDDIVRQLGLLMGNYDRKGTLRMMDTMWLTHEWVEDTLMLYRAGRQWKVAFLMKESSAEQGSSSK
ncbi:MAG: hypothetical protein M1836_000235 [Candelina mexicana]|nr:MAG: hypothetical protein M1836_000235 [Candelina mexicana]